MGITNSVNSAQPRKALSPSVSSTPSGAKVTLVMDNVLRKASVPMVFTFLPMVSVVKLVLSIKAEAPTATTGLPSITSGMTSA